MKPNSDLLDAAALIFRYCRFLRQRIIANPGMLLSALNPEYFLRVKPAETMRTEIRSLYAGDDPDKRTGALRRYKYQELLRIILKELRRRDIRDTFLEMGNLASALLDETLDFYYSRLASSLGIPAVSENEPIECAIIGLGKLGANELNFSSDIDLLFVYGTDDGFIKGRKGDTVNEFFNRLFSYIVRTVSAYSADGFLFRVDTDLRPEGRYGVLANSYGALLKFYENFGSTLDRLALVRARGVAGSAGLAERLISGVSSFVFRKSLDSAAIDEILNLKTALERKGEPSSTASFNVKLDSGGIREIEFIVNALQLIYGGRNPALRTTGTIRALDGLMLSGVLDAQASGELKDSYLFLRRIEHLLQMFDELQTHELPLEGEKFDLVVSSFEMGRGEFLDRLRYTRELVRKHFDDLFFRREAAVAGAEQSVKKSVAEAVVELLHSGLDVSEILEGKGFGRAAEAVADLNRLVMMPSSPFHPVAYVKYRNLAINMLDLALNSADPNRTLGFMIDLLKICSHSIYLFDILDRNREGQKLLFNIFSASSFMSKVLLKDADFLEKVIMGGIPLKPSSHDELKREMSEFRVRPEAAYTLELQSSPIEEKIDFLRTIKGREMIKVAALDLSGGLKPEETGGILSDIADFIVEEVMKCAFELTGADYEAGGFAVLGLGRLGAREMSYLSDLDLIFVFDDALLDAEGFTRTVQKTLHIFRTPSRLGKIYDTDMGLRPSGRQGTLVSSLSAFEEYHRKHVSPWEKFAIMKARFICGDPETGGTSMRIMLDSLAKTGTDSLFVDQMHEMRQKMIKEIARGRGAFYNFKVGKGGLADVEFVCALLQLENINRDNPVIEQNTFRLMRNLFERNILNFEEFEVLYEGYGLLTSLKNRLGLFYSRPVDSIRLDSADLAGIAALMGYGRAEEGKKKFLADMSFFSSAINEIYSKKFGPRAELTDWEGGRNG